MKIAADELIKFANELMVDESIDVNEMKRRFVDTTEAMLRKDIEDNKAIGTNGAEAILAKAEGSVRVLTHCNTGSLATAGYGTALGMLMEPYKFDREAYKNWSRLTDKFYFYFAFRCCAEIAWVESFGARLLHWNASV